LLPTCTFAPESAVVRKCIALLGARTRRIICCGNHDLDSRDQSGEKTRAGSGTSATAASL
jgi:hypothetical protein